MHPARSIILFTTLSGLGFGLLVWLGIDPTPPTGWVAFVFFAIAYALALGGLAASSFHLHHRERALKAFSQWRTSWLSREAWGAAASLSVTGLYALLLLFGIAVPPLGWLGAALALATVGATAMIYAQLKTVPRWHHWSTPALFLALALTGGALLSGRVIAASAMLALSGALQLWVWWDGDKRFARSGTTLATATGLGGSGTPRALFPPHTGSNYLLDEMVYVVGRRHARKLRVIALLLMSLLPLGLLQLPHPHLFGLLALVSHATGVLVSRWLFFAEAEHVVGLYYGRR
ncbi:dimethyl sulfoxide reductase anchor subunit [Salipiger sp. P9]|uniref:dimethyl sulfoxide reductase anchor subunit family protein n=1 Tax=Salipiger pentaromativorans TaxID=2943193 RepID=UPI002157DDC6|nr:DmsC/YnfH family molybdoenzyme membrane anchor subunit [Salipiger pentaromativorans]MCR8549084.1 dimethyl sulfoxide reductase anchor subunit [Salipiger pentaromativorans]